ncbi:hypothetical protein BH23ACT3_BH23ACT3_01740 [soil metagenome]
MQFWKPHSLAVPHTDQLDLRIADRVRATADLPGGGRGGVPEGTEGKILLANGFNWQRYRVLFENGIELGYLDGRKIEPIGSDKRRVDKAAARANR